MNPTGIPLVNDLLKGKVPEVPFSVTVDDKSILKLSVAAVLVATIIILLSAVSKKF